MKLHILDIPKLVLQRRASAILGLIIVIMLWAGVFVSYRTEVQDDYRSVELRNQNYSQLFEENVLRSIGEIDKALLYLRRTVENSKDTTDFQTIVNSTDVLSEIIVQVAIADSKGLTQATNAKPAPTGIIDLSDREHFKVHVNSTEDTLFISKPVVGRASNKWSVQFTRRFLNKDGSFAGIVIASMDPAHFTSFYDKIDLGATTTVALVGSDGVVRSSGGGAIPRLALGQNLTETPFFQHLQDGESAAFEDPGATPDDDFYVTARKVRGYPLWVTVSTQKASVYVSSWKALQRNLLIVGLLTILVLVALEHILRAERAAAQKAKQLQLTLEHISQGIMLVTKDRQVPIINQRAAELLKLPATLAHSSVEFGDLASYEKQHGHISPPIASFEDDGGEIEPIMASREPTISDHRRDDGVFIELRKTELPDGGFVQTFTDITTRRESEAHIARLASQDPLTGLHNRRVFGAELQNLCETANQPDFAVLFMDMDRFKVVNDTIGHRVGDNLLVAVAQRLNSVQRGGEVIARLGGDEFALVIPHFDSIDQVEAVAKRIIDVMAAPFEIGHHRIRTSVSIGIAIGHQDGHTADELLVASDLALYSVKTAGRGSYRFFEKQMNDDVNERREIELELRQALEQGQLELYYQPIVDLKNKVISGFEALARWPHPTKGMISPNTFIAVAEDCGLIVPLGEWAMKTACEAAAKWPEHLRVSVNVSPIQLNGSDLPATVDRVLKETGLAPRRLALEFTERMFIEDSERSQSTLANLKTRGVKIVLDDFGIGYSSLSYLRRFPFDTLKIDRSFISDLGSNASSNIIVQAVILIAGGLGIRTVAEGIETDSQLKLLRALSCDEVQGYLLGKPMPYSEACNLIQNWNGKDVLAA